MRRGAAVCVLGANVCVRGGMATAINAKVFDRSGVGWRRRCQGIRSACLKTSSKGRILRISVFGCWLAHGFAGFGFNFEVDLADPQRARGTFAWSACASPTLSDGF
jgi:hypothetical protein